MIIKHSFEIVRDLSPECTDYSDKFRVQYPEQKKDDRYVLVLLQALSTHCSEVYFHYQRHGGSLKSSCFFFKDCI